MNQFISGAAFGAALTASGVYQPAVILTQLNFDSWHMIQVFLTAAASSACLVTTAQKLGYTRFGPRGFSSIGLFAPYDGNIVGGLLLGAGMALAAACPGTVLVQVGVGVRSGLYALQGAIIGGIVWSGFLHRLMVCPKPEEKREQKLTVYESLGISRSTLLVIFDLMCAAGVAAAVKFTTLGPEAKISPVVGGLLIATAQFVSMLLRKSLMGTSSSFEEVGDWFWDALKGQPVPQKYNTFVYCSGMVASAWLLSKLNPTLAQVTDVSISPLAAGLGGLLIVVGSRMAGGCTSGHGISGLSLFSTSSFITIGTAFAFGGLVGKFIR